MTINKAIRHATATVRMHPWGARSYIVETYCAARHAWITGPQMPFHAARACMTAKRHAVALVALGWAERDAESAAYCCFGSLRDRVKASLRGVT
jgi:hypothetical protein